MVPKTEGMDAGGGDAVKLWKAGKLREYLPDEAWGYEICGTASGFSGAGRWQGGEGKGHLGVGEAGRPVPWESGKEL